MALTANRERSLFENAGTRFWHYHTANPRVYELFKKFAHQAKAAGLTHYGAKAIMERIRWHVEVETQDPAGFKINNNYTSRYARMLVKDCPEFAGFFETRRLRR